MRHDRAGELIAARGALSVEHGRIAALEPDARAPVQIDAGGGAVVPGFVDAHTHLPFGGWGERRETSESAVLRQSRELAAEMLRDGTTTVDCRGATPRDLRLATRLAEGIPQAATTTAAVAAEELPQAIAGTRARAWAIEEAAVAAAGRLAAAHDLWLRVDAQETVASALALGARSVHGLTELRPDEVAGLVAAECAAVLLPVAELLGAEHLAPGRRLADGGSICVLATGCHPVRAPSASLPLTIGLARRLYGWTAAEALLACTLNAAWAVGCSHETGSLEPGKRADVLVLDSPFEQLVQRFGRNPVAIVVCDGEVVWVRPDQAWRVTRRGT